MLCIGLDTSVWVKSSDGAVGLLQDLATFFQERLDGINELLLIEFLFGLALGGVDCLFGC